MSGPHNLTVDECLALLKDASLRAESIAEEMQCAGVSRLQPAQVQAARDVLAKLQSETAASAGTDPKAVAGGSAAAPGAPGRGGGDPPGRPPPQGRPPQPAPFPRPAP